MKLFDKTIFSLALAVILSSCSFLDVNPKGEVFDKDMFSSAEGYEDAIYGIYAELATQQDLYAGNILWLQEAMCVNILASSGAIQYMPVGEYYRQECSYLRSNIWSKTYTAINHINNILSHIEKGGEHEFEYSQLYKGECLALRAFLHFEMLNLFAAPVWAQPKDKEKGIPYVTKYSFDITPFSSVDDAYAQIISDLESAEGLLSLDDILLTAERTNSTAGGFISNRIIHMNKYAVQALLARVYWSKNDMENAGKYANKVIESGKFKFRPTERFVQPDNGTLDMSETIFGFYSKKAQEYNAKQYGLVENSQFTPFTLATDYLALYQAEATSGTDLRLNAWFETSNNNLRKMANSIYYQNSGSDVQYTQKSILGINIIRIPEMYYIMAESLREKDMNLAKEYMDAVLATRGVDLLKESGADLTEDYVFNERRKEFYGEGLIWMDMKRQGRDIVVNAAVTRPGTDVDTYRIPYPKDEDENRE